MLSRSRLLAGFLQERVEPIVVELHFELFVEAVGHFRLDARLHGDAVESY